MDATYISDYLTEPVLIGILLAGIAISTLAYYWLTFRAIAASKWWRIGYLPPFSLLYLLSGSRRVIAPLIVLIFGGMVAASPFVMTHYVQPLMARHPWVKTVDGETHATLTGLKDFDYRPLKDHKEIAVLQMANPEVADATLEFLRGHDALHELDLNDTKITDAGLGVLRDLPNLRTLRVARTAITDDGFRDYLSKSDVLMEIDATGTEIKSATLRTWKSAKDGRKYLK